MSFFIVLWGIRQYGRLPPDNGILTIELREAMFLHIDSPPGTHNFGSFFLGEQGLPSRDWKLLSRHTGLANW